MSEGARRYRGETIDITFDGARCIHAAECVRGLPGVFDTQRRPWILPSGGSAEQIVDVIERCPTGALHYDRRHGGPAELPDAENSIRLRPNGPLYARGSLRLVTPDGELVLQDVRIALCRCGQSQHKPFCDNSHIAAAFADEGLFAEGSPTGDSALDKRGPGDLTVKLRANGPLKLDGPFLLIDAGGQVLARSEAVLCRCGGSANKPFCDGTHRTIGFEA
jgi:CDGSH-type Zn-finger protein/uncharacterized Fe-S cluster protein YjdI